MLVYFFYYVIMSKFYVSVLMSTCMYCMNCFFPSDYAVRAAFLCKHVRLSRVFYNKQYLLTYLLTAVSCPTALGALCGQLTFPLAWCREHSAVMAIELLQPLNLACGTLFQSSCVIPTSPTDCSDDS